MQVFLLSFSSRRASLWISGLPHGITHMVLPTHRHPFSLRTGPHCFHCNQHNNIVNDVAYVVFFMLTLGNLVRTLHAQHVSIRMHHVCNAQHPHVARGCHIGWRSSRAVVLNLAARWNHLGDMNALISRFSPAVIPS